MNYSDFDRLLFFVHKIDEKHINIVESYNQWLRCGMALASWGEPARELFHIMSRQSCKYKYQETERQFNACLKHFRGASSCIGYFMYFCKKEGVLFKDLGVW